MPEAPEGEARAEGEGEARAEAVTEVEAAKEAEVRAVSPHYTYQGGLASGGPAARMPTPGPVTSEAITASARYHFGPKHDF